MITFNKKTLTFCISTLAFLSSTTKSYAIWDFESTRLQSTAGAGVASLLINESSLLNPASIAFFKDSTFYYQKGVSSLDNTNSSRIKSFKDGFSEIVAFSDTSSPINGGFSYQYQNNQQGKRVRYATSISQALGKSSSLGLIYRYSQEDTVVIDEDYHQVVLGFTRVYSEAVTFGLVIVDPFQTVQEYFNYTAGIQYNISEFFTVLADVGSADVQNSEKSSFSKWAIQLQSFRQFFLRYGKFHDRYKNVKGTSYGVSWVGPKLSLDYAIKTSELISNSTDILLADEKLIETSFGFTVLF
jgi:hypothetical protein